MNLPQGFVLEGEQEGPKLPEGFVLENGPIQKMNETSEIRDKLKELANTFMQTPGLGAPIPGAENLLSPGTWMNTINNPLVHLGQRLGLVDKDRVPHDFLKDTTDIKFPNFFPEPNQSGSRGDPRFQEPDVIPGVVLPGLGVGVQGMPIDSRWLQPGGLRAPISTQNQTESGPFPKWIQTVDTAAIPWAGLVSKDDPNNPPPGALPPGMQAVGGGLQALNELLSSVISLEGAPLFAAGGEGAVANTVRGLLAAQTMQNAPRSVQERLESLKKDESPGGYTKAAVGSLVDLTAPALLTAHGTGLEGRPSGIKPTETNLRTGDVDEMQGRVPPERQLALKNAQTILGEVLSQQERQAKAASEYPNFLMGPRGIVQQGDVGGLHDVAQPNVRGLLRAPALESGPTTLPKTLTEAEKLLKGEEADLPTKRQTFRSGVGADEDAAKMLLPAVKFGGRILTGKQGDTHAEILERNGIGPDVVPHSSADRGFLLNGEWLSRQQAAEKMGKTGTADVGGIDSMDLPNAGKFRALRSAGMSKEEVSEILGDDAKFYSGMGLDKIEDVFTPTARLLLRDPKRLRYDPSKTGEYDGGQLVNRLMNQVPPMEKELLEKAGIREAFKPGQKVGAKDIDAWVEKNAPKVEVHTYGMEGKVSEAKKAYNQMTHEWFDNQNQVVKAQVAQALRQGTYLNERIVKQHGGDVEKAKRYLDLGQQVDREVVGNANGPRATSAYSRVSPKDVKKFPLMRNDLTVSQNKYTDVTPGHENNYEFVNRDKQTGKATFRDKPLWESDSVHEQLPNTLGWTAYQDLPHETYGEVRNAVEVQSRWGQEGRRLGTKSSKNPAQEYSEYLKQYIEGFHPLVKKTVENVVNNLHDPNYSYDTQHMRIASASTWEQMVQRKYEALKGLDKDRPLKTPDEFFREVAGRIEGHPLLHDYNRLILKAFIEQARKDGKKFVSIPDAETAMMSEGHDLRVDTFDDQGNNIGITSDRQLPTGYTRRVRQEPRMRLNYDTILPKIMEELTGQKGERVGLGEHKNAYPNQLTERDNSFPSNYSKPRENLIFRNPDGTPKTSVTGLVYDISKVGEAPYSMMGRKLYSGLPIFDPEMWGSAEEAKRAKDKFDRMVLSRKDSPSEVKASAKTSLRERPTEPQSVRAKEILESKTAVRSEPFAKSGRQPGEPRIMGTKAKNVAATVGNFSRDLGRRLAPWDVLMDQMDGGQAKFNGPIFKNVRRAADNQFNERQKLEWSLRDELKNVRKEFKLDDLSAERINVYSVAQQPGGIERMVKTGVKQETIDKILTSMTKGELAYYKARRTLYNKTGPSIQQVAKDVDDVNVKLVPNYTPWERAWGEYIPEADELAKNPNIPVNATPGDVLWPGLAEVGDTRQTPQSLIRRLRSAKSPLKMNAFEVDDRYIADYAHYVTMRKFLKETSNIVRDEKFAKKYGKNNQDLMIDWVNTTARNGKFMAGDWGHVMNWLRRSTAAGALILRPASAIVHTTNISFAIEKIGPGWFARGLDEAWTERGQKFLKQHFAESFTSGEPGINEVTVEGIRPGNLVSRLRSKGFAPQRAIDSTMRFGVNLGYYMKALKEQGKDPNAYDKLPVDQNAVELARVMARRAVASPYAKDVPPAITGGGATRRAFFQFQNMFLDQLSNLTYEGGQVGLKKLLKDKDPRMTASVLLAFTTMLVAETGIKYAQKRGMQAIAGKEPDDKEFQKMLAEEALKRIPAYTQIKGSVGDYGEIGVPALDVPRDAMRSGVKAFNATESGDRIIQGTRAAKGVGELLVPGAGMIGDVAEAAERRMLYEPHDKKLSKASGKKVEDMGWKERYDAEKAFAKTREPMSAEARAKSAERNIGNVVKRGSELLKSVNKADRQWIESRGLSMPGYDNKIREGGTSMYLTKDEMKKMEVYVKEAVEEKMQIVRKKPDVYSQQKNFSELMSSAHAKARSRIIKEIKSHSENESNNNRYSAFRP